MRVRASSAAPYNKYEPHSSTTAIVNLQISNNATWSDAFQFSHPEDETWDLVGCSFELDVQRNPYDLTPLLHLDTADERIVIADPVKRVIYFDVTPDDIQASLKPGTYVYDLAMIDVYDVRTVLMRGTLQVGQGVTYPEA